MSEQNILLTLLIHRRTKEKYYKDHTFHLATQKALIEEVRHQPFEMMPKEKQTYYLDLWYWPPWRFNDIAGFAEIQLETKTNLIGYLYLPERATRVTKRPLLLNYACASASFEEGNLQSIRDAINEVILQLKSTLKDRKWVLEVDQRFINNTNFLGIIEDFDGLTRL